MIWWIAEEDLILDPSVVFEKRQSGSSVTDLYGVQVFTDEFMYRKEMKHMMDLQNQWVKQMVLFHDRYSIRTEEAGVEQYLFRSAGSVDYDYIQEKDSAGVGVSIGVCLAVVLIFSLFFIKYFKKKKKESGADGGMYYSGDSVR